MDSDKCSFALNECARRSGKQTAVVVEIKWSENAEANSCSAAVVDAWAKARDMKPEEACIVNGGGGAWAFDSLARELSAALWVDVTETPREYSYLLHLDEIEPEACGELFIPFRSMQVAGDKRLLAALFASAGVPTPETHLVGSAAEAEQLLAGEPGRDWCLKFPTGCGASGHRLLRPGFSLAKDWPLPLVVQEFIRLERPEVYRLYGAERRLFGWVARRFPSGTEPSPWVAHARGARYELAGEPPAQAVAAAREALEAVGLFGSFGCVDLLRRPDGAWVVLEVGTDGQFNHVDRDLGLPALEFEIQRRVAEAFWSKVGWRPWGTGEWSTRQAVVQ